MLCNYNDYLGKYPDKLQNWSVRGLPQTKIEPIVLTHVCLHKNCSIKIHIWQTWRNAQLNLLWEYKTIAINLHIENTKDPKVTIDLIDICINITTSTSQPIKDKKLFEIKIFLKHKRDIT